MQLFQNQNGISSPRPWHDTKLYLNYIDLMSYQPPINVLTIFKIWSVIRIFFSLTAVDNCTNLTLCGSNSFYAVFSIPVSTADCKISDINPGGPAVFPLLIVNFTD